MGTFVGADLLSATLPALVKPPMSTCAGAGDPGAAAANGVMGAVGNSLSGCAAGLVADGAGAGAFAGCKDALTGAMTGAGSSIAVTPSSLHVEGVAMSSIGPASASAGYSAGVRADYARPRFRGALFTRPWGA